jgi:hypothetical protein
MDTSKNGTGRRWWTRKQRQLLLGGKWCLQAAFDFTEASMGANGPISATGRLITDAYSLGVP